MSYTVHPLPFAGVALCIFAGIVGGSDGDALLYDGALTDLGPGSVVSVCPGKALVVRESSAELYDGAFTVLATGQNLKGSLSSTGSAVVTGDAFSLLYDGSFHDLGLFRATCTNAGGWVGGSLAGNAAVRQSGGTLLVMLYGASSGEVEAVNDSGLCAVDYVVDGKVKAFTCDALNGLSPIVYFGPSSYRDLKAVAVNSSGTVVGTADGVPWVKPRNGFATRPQVTPGWTVKTVTGIDDSGTLCGTACFEGTTVPVLLVP